jgi:hypothetical protein
MTTFCHNRNLAAPRAVSSFLSTLLAALPKSQTSSKQPGPVPGQEHATGLIRSGIGAVIVPGAFPAADR